MEQSVNLKSSGRCTQTGNDYNKDDYGYACGYVNINNVIHAVVSVIRYEKTGKKGLFGEKEEAKQFIVVVPINDIELEVQT